MLEEAQRIQGKDMDAVKRMQRQIDQTEQVAASTMETMKDQTEQIGKIHQDLEEIDDTLKMAGQELTRYARRLATDKVILAFIGLIVIWRFDCSSPSSPTTSCATPSVTRAPGPPPPHRRPELLTPHTTL